jgi:CBS domain-containing protein
MTLIRDVMTGEPTTCTPETSLEEVARRMVDVDCGCLPVVRSEEDLTPIGAITDRDIVCRVLATGRNPLECTVQDCMTTPVITISGEADLDVARRQMTQHRIRRLVVVEDDGTCCGVLSLADLTEVPGAEEVIRSISEPTDAASAVEEKEPEPA